VGNLGMESKKDMPSSVRCRYMRVDEHLYMLIDRGTS
jgi:hypothetical protein